MAAALAVLGACTAGDGPGGGFPTTPSTTSTVAPVTTSTTAPLVPTGSVALRVTGLTLPDLRAGGTGLRVTVAAAGPTLTVRRRGGGGAVSACSAAGGQCVDLGPGATVELAAAGGIELRATAADAMVDEVTVTYLPATRSTTLVTPARPAGACAVRACEATYSLVPGRSGPFVLDGRGAGGRPRLVLTAVPSNSGPGSNRMLATVEGGGILSIRATLEPGSEASLLHHDEGPNAVAPLTAEILWP